MDYNEEQDDLVKPWQGDINGYKAIVIQFEKSPAIDQLLIQPFLYLSMQ